MRYSELFLKTRPAVDTGNSVNAQLLTRAGYIDQVMAGVYAYLPLGLRTLTKIENIIREEMSSIAAEILLPSFSPRSIWETTGRDTIDVLLEARGANEASLARNDSVAILNPTHEDVLTPIAQKIKPSYRDLPFAVFQIQTKFRNEERPKAGLLRGREFRMKDLYSFHASEDSLREYYENAKEVYKKTFNRLGLGDETVIVQASGGDFTKEYSHEFQTFCETGEDVVYIEKGSGLAYNKEVIKEGTDKSKYEIKKASEVGNIFPLGTKFSEAFKYFYTDETGQRKPVYMASYGLGSSRVMGVLVEKFHDESGIIWPEATAPFMVHLVALKDASEVYEKMTKAGIEVLWDDREKVGAGEKFADADLIGIPWRVVFSQKTGDQIEVKRRGTSEMKLMNVEDFIKERTA